MAGILTIALGTMVAVVAPFPAQTDVARADLEQKSGRRESPTAISFEPNEGQTHPSVEFVARAGGATVYFLPSGQVIDVSSAVPGDTQLHDAGIGPSGASIAGPASTPGQVSPLEPGRGAGEEIPALRETLHLRFVGANPAVRLASERPLTGRLSYLVGADPTKWITDVPTFREITYRSLYPGIDLGYDGSGGAIKSTYTVAPGSDPSLIRWRYDGAGTPSVDGDGNLLVHAVGPVGSLQDPLLTEETPIAWQDVAGARRRVPVGYDVGPEGSIGFSIGRYDPRYPLVIDPTMTYSTYLGGSGAEASYGIAADPQGNSYVTGTVGSLDFPAHDDPLEPDDIRRADGNYDAFVTKLNPDGSTLEYTTFIGGAANDVGHGVRIDDAGNVYVAGWTWSTDFPTKAALQPQSGGENDAFVMKLDPSGSEPVFSTYIGGSGIDYANELAVDQRRRVYLTGGTQDSDFPTVDAYQAGQGPTAGNVPPPPGVKPGDAFVMRINSDGSEIDYATTLGGSGEDSGSDITVDQDGSAVLAGVTHSVDFPTANAFQPENRTPQSFYYWDGFVSKLSPNGSELLYSTYLGGSYFDEATGVAMDQSGAVYVTGRTGSTDFPTKDAFQETKSTSGVDAFVTKIAPDGSRLLYSTYLGGGGACNQAGSEARDIAVDPDGHAYVIGDTDSDHFPTVNAYQPMHAVGTVWWDRDVFLTKLDPSGSRLSYSTYLGGSGFDYGTAVDADGAGNAYITGLTVSPDFPTQAAYQSVRGQETEGWDTFVAKMAGDDAIADALVVRHTDLEDPVQAGRVATYRTIVSNHGKELATSVRLRESLATGTTFVSSTPGAPACSSAAGEVICELGSLPVGESQTVDITVQIPRPSPASLVNRVAVTTSTPDPNPNDNASAAETTVIPGPDDACVTPMLDDRCESDVLIYDHAEARGPHDGYEDAKDMAVSPTGDHVYVTGESAPALTRGCDRNGTATVAFDQTTGEQVWVARKELPGPPTYTSDAIAVSPDGQRIFETGIISSGGGSEYDMFTVARDAETGRELWTAEYEGERKDGWDQGLNIAVSADASRVYVGGSVNANYGGGNGDYGTVAYDALSGDRLWVSIHDSGGYDSMDATYEATGLLAASPTGDRLYVSGHSPPDPEGVVDFVTIAYDGRTGERLWLSRFGHALGADFPSALGVSADGSRLFVTGAYGSPVTSHEIAGRDLCDLVCAGGQWHAATVAYESGTGTQLWSKHHRGLNQGEAAALAVSPTGDHVYVTGATQEGPFLGYHQMTLAYDQVTGEQRWVAGHKSGLLNAGGDVTTSSDGSRVYATGLGDGCDSVTTAYDAATGLQKWAAATHIGCTTSFFRGVYESRVGVSPSSGRVFRMAPIRYPAWNNMADYGVLVYDE